jgi:hypothetical protein
LGRKQPRREAQPLAGKTPRSLPSTSQAKVPRDQAGPSFLSLRPAWRVGSLELLDDSLGWHRLDASDLHRVRERLSAFETMTWADLLIRLTGAERIFGYLEQGVFVALWWDPEHRVCPSIKKHT